MDHAGFMGVMQGVGDLDTQLGGFARSEAFGGHPFLQRRALDEVADDVDCVVLLADFVDADDIGMF